MRLCLLKRRGVKPLAFTIEQLFDHANLCHAYLPVGAEFFLNFPHLVHGVVHAMFPLLATFHVPKHVDYGFCCGYLAKMHTTSQ